MTKHPFHVKTVSAWDFTGYSVESLQDAIRVLNKAKGTNHTLPGPLNNILKAFHSALELKGHIKDAEYNPVFNAPTTPAKGSPIVADQSRASKLRGMIKGLD